MLNRTDIFESLLDDVIADVNDNRTSSVEKITQNIDTSDWSPEKCDAKFALQFKINRINIKCRRSWTDFRDKMHKFNDAISYGLEQNRFISLSGRPIYMINNDKLNNDYYRKNEDYKDFFQIDDLWFYNEKVKFIPEAFSLSVFWANVGSNCPTFDVYIPCRFNIPARKLTKLIPSIYQMVVGIIEYVFNKDAQCSEESFINRELPPSSGTVRFITQIVNDVENGLKKPNVIDALKRLHIALYGEVKEDIINEYFDRKNQYSKFALEILHHFSLNLKDVILGETNETVFITIPYNKSIRFTRCDIDWLLEKKSLFGRYIHFEVTGTLNTIVDYLSNRPGWYHLSSGYTRRWEEFLLNFLAPNIGTWNAEFNEVDYQYKIDLSRFYVDKMKVSFTGNGYIDMKRPEKTAEIIFDREPHELKIYNYQKNPR